MVCVRASAAARYPGSAGLRFPILPSIASTRKRPSSLGTAASAKTKSKVRSTGPWPGTRKSSMSEMGRKSAHLSCTDEAS